jgi:hypothetical protein
LYPEAHQGKDVSLNQVTQGWHSSTIHTSLTLAQAKIAQCNQAKDEISEYRRIGNSTTAARAAWQSHEHHSMLMSMSFTATYTSTAGTCK